MMKQLHRQEKEQFKKLFQQEQIDQFELRFKVLDVFMQTEKHVTSAELVALLHDRGVDLRAEFVRETLKLMCCLGFAQKRQFDNGQVRYEHRHIGQHHDHMICTKCKRIIEFSNEALENLQIKIADEHGFHMLQHKMEIYGICTDCLQQRDDCMPLTNARTGEKLVIKAINGGAASRMRLMAMGLRIGDAIEVITNLGQGQVVVALELKRYSLGRGLAQKIIVQPQ